MAGIRRRVLCSARLQLIRHAFLSLPGNAHPRPTIVTLSLHAGFRSNVTHKLARAYGSMEGTFVGVGLGQRWGRWNVNRRWEWVPSQGEDSGVLKWNGFFGELMWKLLGIGRGNQRGGPGSDDAQREETRKKRWVSRTGRNRLAGKEGLFRIPSDSSCFRTSAFPRLSHPLTRDGFVHAAETKVMNCWAVPALNGSHT
ncbi:hypothetical protein EV426DRAFT_574887 [Tirmania nivea]|nr:hypothetical protein EV426DRAFT_574887 [Tirmania nivea]